MSTINTKVVHKLRFFLFLSSFVEVIHKEFRFNAPTQYLWPLTGFNRNSCKQSLRNFLLSNEFIIWARVESKFRPVVNSYILVESKTMIPCYSIDADGVFFIFFCYLSFRFFSKVKNDFSATHIYLRNWFYVSFAALFESFMRLLFDLIKFIILLFHVHLKLLAHALPLAILFHLFNYYFFVW